jgi:antirestriction protein ArdC
MNDTTINSTRDRDALYREITESIIQSIEEGAGSGAFRMPWNRTPLTHRSVDGRPYRGLNVLLLSVAALRRNWTTPTWGTLRAWNAVGGKVRKGERGTRVILWKKSDAPSLEENEGDAGDDRTPPPPRLYARSFVVFNVAQIEGIDPNDYAQQPKPIKNLVAPDLYTLEAVTSIGCRVEFGGVRACYLPAFDLIQMPDRWRFEDQRAITSVLAHEAIHATGHKDRLAREFGKRFGDRAYAVEELVAELGAAMFLGNWSYRMTQRDDHARYIASWLAVLREQPRAILTVASQAQRAADFLLEAATRRETARRADTTETTA